MVASNEAWFGRDAIIDTMRATARWRAVETGRAIVHAADGGPTMVVDGAGHVLSELPRARRTYGLMRLPLSPPGFRTPYAVWGWLFLPITAGATILLVAASLARARAARSRRG